MHVGLFTFNTEYTIAPDRLAIAAEERGFESIWVPEHTHIPVPTDGTDDVRDPMGGILPREYRHMMDPFASLAAAAAVTKRIKLGTGICLVNQHHPITLAKAVATVDYLSNGRVIFGVGAGWNKGEMGDHGIRFEDRWAQTAERVNAIKRMWLEEKPSFKGKYVQFDASYLYPKPVQRPHPPIVLGTLDTEFGRAQVAKHGDGWLPLTFDVNRTRASIDDVRKRMRALGRDPANLDVSLFFLEDKEQDRTALMQAMETGAGRSILRLPTADEATVLRRMDKYALLLQSVR
jgi:probable F420-dependent oxidoreductase